MNDKEINKNLSNFCRNVTNVDGDTFVGLKYEWNNEINNYDITVNFPIGYDLSNSDEIVRKEIISLLKVLEQYDDDKSKIISPSLNYITNISSFPILDYYKVIVNYLNFGYYMELEEMYEQNSSGSINWKQTIHKEKPIVQKHGFVYPNYRVRISNYTDKDLITEIHKFCVYESFLKLGWLYKLKLPPKPVSRYSVKRYISFLKNKMSNTNLARDKRLFKSMLIILQHLSSSDNPSHLHFGTYNFEYIWEKLIDETYGIKNKRDYFPNTSWNVSNESYKMSSLEPDTIMLNENNPNVYVLDAKYYKYGNTLNIRDLPNSSSINKQISYGEYIATNKKFEKQQNEGMQVYNAFLMPFNKVNNNNSKNSNYYRLGEATADWKNSYHSYERVQGILVDVKHLINSKVRPNINEIYELSSMIEKHTSLNN